MLLSMISSTSAGPAWQKTLAPSTALPRSMGHFSRKSRPQQQIRNFRISLWSSYLDPSFRKEIRRRYRRVEKYKHNEALNRKLSWDRHFPANQQVGLKGFMCSAWRSHDFRPGGRWVNVEDLRTGREEPEPNAESGSAHDGIDKLYEFIRASSRIFGNGWTSTDAEATGAATTATSNPNSKCPPQKSPDSVKDGKEGYPRRFQQQEMATESKFDIDPITNRRIPQKSDPGKADEFSVKTSKNHRSQIHEFEPVASKVELTSPEIIHSLRDRLESYQSLGVEQSQVSDPIQDGLKSYDEKVDYESRRFYDCEGMAVDYSDPVQNGLKDYDNKISNGKACPVSNNSSSNSTPPLRDGLVDYDLKAGSRQGRPSEEIEERPKHLDPVSQAFKDYKLRIENPMIVRSSDSKPDPLDPVEQAVRDYESSDLFREAQKKKEADNLLQAIRHYEENFKHMPKKMTGETLDPENSDPILQAIRKYRSHTDTLRNGLESHESLDPILKAFREYKPATEAYEASSNAEEPAPIQIQSNEEDRPAFLEASNTSSPPQNQCRIQEGLAGYDAKVQDYKKPSSSNAKSLAFTSTPPVRSALRDFSEDKTEDLDLLRTSDVRAASGIIKNPSKETELQKHHKRKQLEESFESVQNARSAVDEAAAANKVHASRKLAEELLIEHSKLLNHVAHARGRVNSMIAEVEAGWKPEVSDEQMMTGNFVRDFPEEFEARWTNPETGGAEGLKSKSKAGQETSTDPLIGLAPDAFSRAPGRTRMESSLDRTNSRRMDSSTLPREANSTESIAPAASKQSRPRHKEDQIARNEQRMRGRDLVREVRGIYEDSYGTIDSKHRQVPVPERANAEPKSTTQSTSTGQTIDLFVNTPQPTLYKILAYDPTMQSISIAETTSIVPDLSDTLTPAEVLLRLSNPSKFFPHFQSLQSQGYEIVAGSGDVLVFRKVRSGSPFLPKSETPAGYHETNVTKERKRVTNPIDGMQSTPITGDFASPTGFVNYDRHQGPEVPFKSNIDVRREEPVFSGRRNWEDDSGEERSRGKEGRAKRLLVGAAWVAGCSYAVGVVSEFFRTGGADGKGMRNLGGNGRS
ncbi:uncharacterized protein RAG0_17000 [Rhynchosporium agropyri]|uniref:Uncharacterized protein n=1 Tax=Rhynchosporium agropyri TaxID=914238 RepID=A0A1E1LSR3_9HELO|nr:uncharacterized protein RAG0_17000 [Rhynchosporium agropyri]